MKPILLIFLLTTFKLFSQNSKKNELLIPYRDGNLWGLCDTLGIVKAKPFISGLEKFAVDSDFMGKYVIKKKNKISIINQYKKTLLPETDLDSLELSNFSNNILVYKSNKVGLLRDFKNFIPIEYDNIFPTLNQSYTVRKDGKVGLINNNGKLVIPILYSQIGRPRKENDDKNKFDWVAFFDDSKIDNYVDEKILGDKKVIQGYTVYESEENQEKINEKYEKRKREYNRIESKYGKIVSFSDGYAIIKNEKKYVVYVTKNDGIVLENDDIIEDFYSNYGKKTFLVRNNNKFGLIDETGKVLLDSIYDKIKYQFGGICFIEKDNKKGLFILNSTYKQVEPKYKKIEILESIPVKERWQFGIFEVTTMNDKKGFLGENGVEYFKN
ncbi:WG repeat-containing protein [Epilithonimonas caeni]|uniref:WG repeat-containing protein n=1 Tax=Epilithonimonas caeni TaxID=365343 RepID=UPI0004012B1F|nr:WG repeat-containing protein [Epilithonimonas caeni]